MTRWHPLLVLLHWTMAAALLAMVCLGLLMARAAALAAETGDYGARVLGLSLFDAYQFHKSVGVVLFMLVLFRLVWRLRHPGPGLPADMPRGERLAARGVHVALYALMLSMPLTGWLLASASPLGIRTVVFGILPLPHPLTPDAGTEAVLSWLHFLGGVALLALAGLHVMAALKHHFIDRDDVLRAMLPRRPRGDPSRPLTMLALLLLSCLDAMPAAAQPAWTVEPDRSTLSFAVSIGGSAATGGFADWSAEIRFDPLGSRDGAVRAEIVMRSVFIDAAQARDAIAGPAWLDATNHPVAIFEADDLEWDGHALTLPGRLTLRGTTAPLTLAGTLLIEGDTARAVVSGTLRREGFGVGDANPAVSGAVTITIALTARRAD